MNKIVKIVHFFAQCRIFLFDFTLLVKLIVNIYIYMYFINNGRIQTEHNSTVENVDVQR